MTFLCYLHLFHHVLIFTHWSFYITYTYTYFGMYWFFYIDISTLLTVVYMSSCINFYTSTFLCYLHLHLSHYVLIVTHWHFRFLTLILILLCINFGTSTFSCYLNLYLSNHVLNLAHLHFYITYIYTSFIMYLILHIDIFILLTLILFWSRLDFHTSTFLYYLHLYLFLNLLIFSPWQFYITYTYSYFIMYWFLHNDIFAFLTLILLSSCIDFYTLTCLY